MDEQEESTENPAENNTDDKPETESPPEAVSPEPETKTPAVEDTSEEPKEEPAQEKSTEDSVPEEAASTDGVQQETPQTLDSDARPTPNKSAGLLRSMLGVFLAFIVVAAFAGSIWLYLNRDLGPRETFNRMLQNNLDVTTYTQVFKGGSDAANFMITADGDFSDIQHSKISGVMDMHLSFFGSIDVQAELIMIDDDVYLRYKKFDVTAPEGADGIELPSAEELLDTWVILVRDGQPTGTDDLSLAGLSEATNTVLGEMIIGNFSDEQDDQIYTFINDNNVYSFDETAVTTETIADMEAYKYDVNIDTEQLAELIKLVAPMAMAKDTTLAGTLQSIQDTKNLAVWVSKRDQRLLKMELVDDGTTFTIEYSNYGQPFTIEAPDTDLTLDQLQQQAQSAQ